MNSSTRFLQLLIFGWTSFPKYILITDYALPLNELEFTKSEIKYSEHQIHLPWKASVRFFLHNYQSGIVALRCAWIQNII